jgi:hypothetical protein
MLLKFNNRFSRQFFFCKDLNFRLIATFSTQIEAKKSL